MVVRIWWLRPSPTLTSDTRINAVLVGGGASFLAHHGRRNFLEMLGIHRFGSQRVYLHYRVLC